MRTLALAAVVGVAVGCTAREDEVANAPEAPVAAPAAVAEQPTQVVPAADVPSRPIAAPPEVVAEPDDDSPSIVAYPPPRIENVFVRRSGPEVNLVARVSRVRGASRYELQVAKTLLFDPLLAEASSPGRVVKVGPLSPGMFFVHARAVGAAGEGPFGDVRVVNAQKSGVAKLVAFTPEDAFEPTLAGLPPEKAATPVLAAAEGQPPAGASMTQSPAVAQPPPDLGPVHKRYEQLQRELAEVEAVRRDVQAKVLELQGRLAGAKAKSAASLKADLEVLESTRAQLDREIAAGLAELDRLQVTAAKP